MRTPSLPVLLHLILLLALGAPPAIAATHDNTIPTAHRESVANAEALGRLIYLHDKAAWLSTDALLAASALQSPPGQLRGWVTQPGEGDRISVGYLALVDGKVVAFARADTWPASGGTANARRLPVPDSLTPAESRLMDAIALAKATDGPLNCSNRPWNVVAFDDPGEQDGILVFLMSPWTNETAPLGGFEMFRIDAEGDTILERFTQTHGCVNMPTPDLGKSAALAVTHLTSPSPTAFHVFMSLQYEKPVYVSTSDGLWVVENGEVAYTGDSAGDDMGNE